MSNKKLDLTQEKGAQEFIKSWEETKADCIKTYADMSEDIDSLKNKKQYYFQLEDMLEKNFKIVYGWLNPYTNQLPKVLEYIERKTLSECTLTSETYEKLHEVVKEAKAWKKKFVQLKKQGKTELLFLKLNTVPMSTRVVDITEAGGRLAGDKYI